MDAAFRAASRPQPRRDVWRGARVATDAQAAISAFEPVVEEARGIVNMQRLVMRFQRVAEANPEPFDEAGFERTMTIHIRVSDGGLGAEFREVLSSGSEVLDAGVLQEPRFTPLKARRLHGVPWRRGRSIPFRPILRDATDEPLGPAAAP